MRHSNSYTRHKFLQGKKTFNVLSRDKTLFPKSNCKCNFNKSFVLNRLKNVVIIKLDIIYNRQTCNDKAYLGQFLKSKK